jgi:hypothetical protein
MSNHKCGFHVWLSSFGLLLGFFEPGRSFASDARTYFIAAANGYGVEDCLGEGGECGKVLADAWCNGFGRGVALKFGRSEVTTNVTSETSTALPAPYFITCGD